ncbi:hypothetical protein LTR37_015705 [Vermiconidia calcicola]|uniref:Uncharacterized protein n=1 Tax=Vermiconidia calcicola TaxID=1690605 RepID=A0ACC3MRH6_9PEZI|nr:hypothetical protein LTR37_015705 [Vermiconidia calcicola]
MKAFVAYAFSVLLASASAQQVYTIDPRTVDQATRDFWCQSQQTQCPLICLQPPARSSETRQNDCDSDALTYSCVCSNGLSPNVSEYSQTLPFFLCQEWGTQCAADCGQDNTCASSCREDHPCGAQSPSPPNRTAITTMTATQSSSADSGVYSGFAGASASASAAAGAGAMAASPPFGQLFGHTTGTTLVLAAFFLGFALVL